MTTIHLALVDDWELSGNGSGDIRQLQFEPLRRLVAIYNRLGRVFFRKALALLSDGKPSFQLNDGSGRRYFVMSKLFQGVVDRLLQD
jgi:hypothetical protein